jgi:hypothetical protein
MSDVAHSVVVDERIKTPHDCEELRKYRVESQLIKEGFLAWESVRSSLVTEHVNWLCAQGERASNADANN